MEWVSHMSPSLAHSTSRSLSCTNYSRTDEPAWFMEHAWYSKCLNNCCMTLSTTWDRLYGCRGIAKLGQTCVVDGVVFVLDLCLSLSRKFVGQHMTCMEAKLDPAWFAFTRNHLSSIGVSSIPVLRSPSPGITYGLSCCKCRQYVSA